MNVRDQIINFLLAQVDAKDAVISENQKKIAELQQQVAKTLPEEPAN